MTWKKTFVQPHYHFCIRVLQSLVEEPQHSICIVIYFITILCHVHIIGNNYSTVLFSSHYMKLTSFQTLIIFDGSIT